MSINDPREEASARSMGALNTMLKNLDSIHLWENLKIFKQGSNFICFAFSKDHSYGSG